MKKLVILIAVLLLVACSSTPESEPQTPLPTYTLYPTYTPYPTLVAPSEVPTETKPAATATTMPTIDPNLVTDKEEGVWLVSIEVAPGLWRASGDCYAVTYDKAGEQLDMVSGNKSIISIPPSVFSVKFVSYPGNCTWSYLGE